jgi:hypothetical protein
VSLIPYPRFPLSLMVRNRGSTATQMPVPPPDAPRRSSRRGRGTGSRDAQLDELGDVLVAPTRKRKSRFVPDDVDSLPVNPRAPAPKRKRRKRVCRVQMLSLPYEFY